VSRRASFGVLTNSALIVFCRDDWNSYINFRFVSTKSDLRPTLVKNDVQKLLQKVMMVFVSIAQIFDCFRKISLKISIFSNFMIYDSYTKIFAVKNNFFLNQGQGSVFTCRNVRHRFISQNYPYLIFHFSRIFIISIKIATFWSCMHTGKIFAF
jgi:hypothetical protein